MKTLLLTATLLAATGAVAAPTETAPATQIAPAVALSPYDQLTFISRTQFEAQDFAGMQKTMEQALELASTPKEKSEALRRLTLALFQQGMNAPARDAAQKMLVLGVASGQDNLDARNNIISSYINEKKWEDARQASEAFLADPLTPTEAKWKPRFSLGLSYGELKNDEKAREQLELVVADIATPPSVRGTAQLLLGRIYQKSEELDKARQSFEATTKISGLSSEILLGAYQGWSEVAEKQNRSEDAKSAFAQARNLLMQKADGQYKAKDFDGAIKSYKAALETGTPEPKTELVAHMQLGSAYQSLGDTDASIAEFKYVVDTDPSVSDPSQPDVLKTLKPLALLSLAKGYIAQKKFEPARVALNRFMDYNDDMFIMLLRKQAEDLLKSLPPKQ